LKKKMMSIIKKIFASSLLLLFAVSCSVFKVGRTTPEINLEKLEYPHLNLNMLETHAWINKMPGLSGNKINISGKFLLKESIYYNWESIRLQKVKVFQKRRKLFTIIPEVKLLKKNFNGKILVFSTIKGIEPPPYFSANNTVRLELVFKDGAKIFTYKISDVPVEKAY